MQILNKIVNGVRKVAQSRPRVGAIVYAILGLIYGIFFLLTMCCTTTRTYEISYAVGMILGAFLLCPIIFGFFGFVFLLSQLGRIISLQQNLAALSTKYKLLMILI